jgi:predicted transcriptional regulator
LKKEQPLVLGRLSVHGADRRKPLRSPALNATVCSVTECSSKRRPLTELQQAILDFVWTNGTATAEQVREAIALKHPLKESSIRTLLGRLESYGYLAHAVEGKTFVYRATTPRESVAVGAVRSIIERFWAGSVEQFLAGMVDEEVLSLDQLEQLSRRVRNRK